MNSMNCIEDLENNQLENLSPSITSHEHDITNNLPSSFKIEKVKNEKIYLKIAQFTFLKTAKTLKDSFNYNLDINILDTYINNKKHYNSATALENRGQLGEGTEDSLATVRLFEPNAAQKTSRHAERSSV